MDFSKVSDLDKMCLMSVLGIKGDHPRKDVEHILEKNIKDYSIDLRTGKISVTLVQPLELWTVTVNTGE